MNEATTRAERIDPALKQAGWGVIADSKKIYTKHLHRREQ
jgi:Holliday junction resolvasome RuvABC endonuclease subunit